MAGARKFTRASEGDAVVFHGYDNRAYQAVIVRVRGGVVVIDYPVVVEGKQQAVRAYVHDTSRLEVKPC